ncbi:hypothetical protein CSW14_10465 [Thermus scotoductus]|jgi:DNA repair protein RadC|uniref:DNA repair protein RadC n=1 Tax=Thermus scotoductus TaxID=37636 RepID=A0A430VFX8_THESC|nr:hypothetical protein [Thermus scotoductus]RTI49979.1 hypothetical protein CSW14_10465 [Thermus scotoductus]
MINPRRWIERAVRRRNPEIEASDEALLGVLLTAPGEAGDGREAARKVLALCGGDLSRIPELDVEELMAIPGIGPGRAARVVALGIIVQKLSRARRFPHYVVDIPETVGQGEGNAADR